MGRKAFTKAGLCSGQRRASGFVASRGSGLPTSEREFLVRGCETWRAEREFSECRHVDGRRFVVACLASRTPNQPCFAPDTPPLPPAKQRRQKSGPPRVASCEKAFGHSARGFVRLRLRGAPGAFRLVKGVEVRTGSAVILSWARYSQPTALPAALHLETGADVSLDSGNFIFSWLPMPAESQE